MPIILYNTSIFHYKDLLRNYLTSVTVTCEVWVWHVEVWLPVQANNRKS